MNTVVVKGPQGCGKTFHAQRLAEKFGCVGVVDEWRPGVELTPEHLHLTNAADVVSVSPEVRVVRFEDCGLQSEPTPAGKSAAV